MTIGLFVLVFLIGVGVGTFLTMVFGKKNDGVISPPAKENKKPKDNPFGFNETQMPTVPNPLYENSPYSFRYLTKDGTYADVVIGGKQLYKLLNKYGDEEFELIKKAIEKDRPTIISGCNWYEEEWLKNKMKTRGETIPDITVNGEPIEVFNASIKNENAGGSTRIKSITVPKPKGVPDLIFYSKYLSGNKDKHLKESYTGDRQRSDGNDMAIKSTNITSWRTPITEIHKIFFGFFTMLNHNDGMSYLVKRFDRQPDYDVYKWGLTEVWHSDIMVTAIYQDLLVLSEA